MTKRTAIILVNYKDYALKYLSDCWASLRAQDYAGARKVFIVDNESTAESYEHLKSVCCGGAPPNPALSGEKFEIIRNKKNDGFAKGNNDAIKLALEQGFDYVILFNMDTVVAPDCVSKMIEMAENPPGPFYQGGGIQPPPSPLSGRRIGAVQARLMMYNEKSKINSLGNATHFLGFGYCLGYKEEYNPPSPPASSAGQAFYQEGINICYPSGAAVLFKAEVLKKVGFFDEEFWMYNEDQDLGWRVWLAGFRCVLAPDAVVYHKYEFSRSIKKYYCLDRNRIMVMLKNYGWPTLVLVFPAFTIMEIGLIFFSLKNGWFYEKAKVYSYFLNLTNWRRIMAERKKVQGLRTVKDGQIIKLLSGKIWYQEIGERRLKVANVIFNAYWQIAKGLIKW